MGLKLNGATSGSIEIDVPAVAGTDTAITIPATTGGEFIVSDSSGRVGIGTTSPAGPLEVAVAANRNLLVTGEDNSYTRIGGIQGGTSNNRNLNLTGENLFFSTGSSSGTSFTERVRIDNSGRLLVGTTSAFGGNAELLQIARNGGGGIALLRNDLTVSSGNELGAISWYGNDS
jgi:hypothetical protein